MQYTLLALAAVAARLAAASLNCTVVAPTVTLRDCEWDGCRAHATAKAGDVLHAGCRADCASLDDPWLKLYDGSYVRTNDALANCRYFCEPYAITGLPTCAWEHNVTDPGLAFCAASSVMGVATTQKLLGPSTLGTEPAPVSGIPTAGTACDWTKTPATLAPKTTSSHAFGGSPRPPTATTPSATATPNHGTNGTTTAAGRTSTTSSSAKGPSPTTMPPMAGMNMFRRHT